MSASDTNADASSQQERAQRIHERLKGLGATLDQVTFALDQNRKREQIRASVLRGKPRGQAAQAVALHASPSTPTRVDHRSVEASDRILNRLMEISNQIIEVRAALAVATANREGQAEERNLAELLNRLEDVRKQINDAKAEQALISKKVDDTAGRAALGELKGRIEEVRNHVVDTKTGQTLLAASVESKADGGVLAELKDQLIDVRDQIVETKGTVTSAAESIEGQPDEGAFSKLAASVDMTQDRLRQVLWILSVATGIVGPAVVALLALAIWGASVG